MIAVSFQPVIMCPTVQAMASVLISMSASAIKVGLEKNVHNIPVQTWITAQVNSSLLLDIPNLRCDILTCITVVLDSVKEREY